MSVSQEGKGAINKATYETKREAIEREIIPALGDFANDFDIAGLADAVLDDDENGYWCKVTPQEFYEIAQQYDLSETRERK